MGVEFGAGIRESRVLEVRMALVGRMLKEPVASLCVQVAMVVASNRSIGRFAW